MQPLNFPLLDQFGEQDFQNPADPAAGSNKGLQLPINYVYKFNYLKFRIVTSATVVNRYPGINIANALGPAHVITPATAITAGQTMNVVVLPSSSLVSYIVGNYYIYGIPGPQYLDATDTISTAILNIDATDQVSLFWLGLTRWPYQSV